jgi:uncharacterized lipoprotein YehR (DUF1307 family)
LVVLALVASMLSLSITGCGGEDSSKFNPEEATPEQAALKAKYLETHPPPGTKPAKKSAKRK